jgi:hypothetical protein
MDTQADAKQKKSSTRQSNLLGVIDLAQINKQVKEKWKSENEVIVWLNAAAQ